MRVQVIILFALVAVASCKNQVKPAEKEVFTEKEVSDALIEINQYMVKENQLHIRNFIKRSGWDMKETESGIWIEFLEDKKGDVITEGERVNIEYTIRMINGKAPEGISQPVRQTMTFGKSETISGLKYAIAEMSKGDSVRVIIPPYLAYGNFGDSGKVPPSAILIFEIKMYDQE